MIEHALLLIGRTHKGQPETARAAQTELAAWRDRSATHADAVRAAQQLWEATDGSALVNSVPVPRSPAPTNLTRRRVVGLLGASGLAALLAAGGGWYWQQPVYTLSLATGHSQMLERTLPDGTQLSLAARTQGSIVYYRDRREVRLVDGEIRFQVTPDAERPFSVATDWGRVRVLGTTFSVRARENGMRVAVSEGRVGVWPGRADRMLVDLAGEPAAVLQGGEAIESDGQRLGPPMAIQPDSVGAWRHGWLVFDNTPLPEALARWNDYLQRPVRLGGSAELNMLRLSGSFPLRNPQAFLAGLPDILPVRIVQIPGGAATIEMR
ncbi:FecR family protein [Variovorax arabinosiphilus]|nr:MULTISPECIES: FecR domain-containing protein [unclassified Variovorax]MDM0131697.1 FecR domain-containing protein [Variovorax sp. J2L1-63]MDM0236070.1 FecR domain-containing protein [Variovorax sp. J2R1-6]